MGVLQRSGTILALLLGVWCIVGLPGTGLATPLDPVERLLEQGNLAEALVEADARVARTPSWEAHSLRGRILLAQGRPSEALRDFEQSLRLAPHQASVHVGRGQALESLGRGQEALAECECALALQPGSIPAITLRAAVLLRLGRGPEAAWILDSALREHPDDPSLLLGRTRVALHQGRVESARPRLDALVRVSPDCVEARLCRADLLCRAGDLPAARADLDAVAARHPGLVQQWMQRGAMEAAAGFPQAAQEAFTRVLAREPGHLEARIARCEQELILGRGAEAAVDAEEAFRLGGVMHPLANRLLLLAWMGDAMAGRPAAARARLEMARALGATSTWPYPVIAWLLGERTETAVLTDATSHPRLTEARSLMGVAMAASGRREDAVRCLRWVRDHGDSAGASRALALGTLRRLETVR